VTLPVSYHAMRKAERKAQTFWECCSSAVKDAVPVAFGCCFICHESELACEGWLEKKGTALEPLCVAFSPPLRVCQGGLLLCVFRFLHLGASRNMDESSHAAGCSASMLVWGLLFRSFWCYMNAYKHPRKMTTQLSMHCLSHPYFLLLC